MRARFPISHVAISALLLGSALLAVGCEEEKSYQTVGVTTPELATEGPVLTDSQWRQRVGEICQRAMSEVSAVSAKLAAEIRQEPAAVDDAEISRRAFEASRPVIEQQLGRLAALRPPPEVEEEYRRFIAMLATELRWSGRIAHMIGEEGADEELLSADRSLAAAASEVTAFVQAHRLRGCLPSGY